MIIRRRFMTKHNKGLDKRLFKSYLGIFILFFISILAVVLVSFIGAKGTLEKLGEEALKNKINMGIEMMDMLETQVKNDNLAKEEAQEIFKNKMLNEKGNDGKTRGLNKKLELGIEAYMYAIDSNGIEKMHPFKEGENISNLVDSKGENVTKLIIKEGKNPENGGLITFWWKNPDEKQTRKKVNAVVYYEPWDWYLNVGCYYEDFYGNIVDTFRNILIVAILILIMSILLIRLMISKKVEPLNKVIELIKKIGDGDLSSKVNINSKDEIGYMASTLNNALDEIKSMVVSLKETSEKINEKIKYVNEVTNTTSETSQNITKAVEEIACSATDTTKDMEISFDAEKDLTDNIALIKDTSLLLQNEAINASKLNSNILNVLKNLEDKSIENLNLSEETSKNMNILTDKSNTIIKIVNTIENISKQINLLALNASIESSKAGVAGKGFAVVAQGIKELSEQTEQSTNHINQHVNELMKSILYSEESVNKTKKSSEIQRDTIKKTQNIFMEVIKFIEEVPKYIENNVIRIEEVYNKNDTVNSSMDAVLGLMQGISSATEEITSSMTEVNKSILEINDMIDELGINANELNEKSQKFKIK
ncbi:chemotaxis protein [Clostridium tetani]|nr:chemotaxis protein [Clostridium tetani]